MTTARLCFFVFAVISAGFSIASTQSVQAKKNESQLFKDLFGNYDSLVWPNRNHHPNWSISTRMFINSLVDFNEKDQVLSISALFGLSWDESLLSWDPDVYDIEVLYVPPHMIWKPEIIIENAVENYGQIGKENLDVYLDSDGGVMWMPGDFYKLYCKVDVRHYPFDTQTCTIKLNPWSCPQRIINLDLPDQAIIIKESEENGEWKLVHSFAEKIWFNQGRRFRINFNFVLQRKTLFYVVNMILPIVFLSLLNSLTFALPVNSGEKMTLCISVLLSYAVFLTLVNDALPENSDGVCFFSAYLATEIFMSAAATVVTVVVLSYHHHSQGTLRARRWMSWILSEGSLNKVNDEVWAIKNLGANPEKEEEDGQVKRVAGSEVARALDKLALRLFSLANVIITLVFFCAMYGGM